MVSYKKMPYNSTTHQSAPHQSIKYCKPIKLQKYDTKETSV